jgi:hypothetical protein
MKSAYWLVSKKYNEYFNFKCEPATFKETPDCYYVAHIKKLNEELVKQHLEYRKAQSLTCCNDVVDALF